MPLRQWRALAYAGVSHHAVLIRLLGADPRKCRILRTLTSKPAAQSENSNAA